MSPLVGSVAAVALAAVGWALGWLTRTGAIAAAAVGAATLGGAGIPGAVLLGLFFLTGSLLTAANDRGGAATAGTSGARRTAAQVLANGSAGAVAALGVAAGHTSAAWAALIGAFAAAQGDTWATEIGMRSRTPPVSIVTGRPVPAGTSGGVTTLGVAAGVAGVATAALAARLAGVPMGAVVVGGIAGTCGMVADSLLGATVQGIFRCDGCGRTVETRHHRCPGTALTRISGYAWIDNHVVNLGATTIGAGLGAALSWLWH